MKNLLLCTFASLMLVACGNGAQDVSTVTKAPTSAPEAAKPAPQRARIALVMKTLTNPFFIEMEKGARRASRHSALISW
jgi:ribose transport system substrate-binding protein